MGANTKEEGMDFVMLSSVITQEALHAVIERYWGYPNPNVSIGDAEKFARMVMLYVPVERVNRILGEKRMTVTVTPATIRDLVIDVLLDYAEGRDRRENAITGPYVWEPPRISVDFDFTFIRIAKHGGVSLLADPFRALRIATLSIAKMRPNTLLSLCQDHVGLMPRESKKEAVRYCLSLAKKAGMKSRARRELCKGLLRIADITLAGR